MKFKAMIIKPALLISCSIMFSLFISSNAYPGFWDSVEKATEKVEKANEKEEKVDRLNRAVEDKAQKKRDKTAATKQKAAMKKSMQTQMCTQYMYMNSKTMKDAYKNDKALEKQMKEQMENAIDQMNIEYERNFGETFNYKKECKK